MPRGVGKALERALEAPAAAVAEERAPVTLLQARRRALFETFCRRPCAPLPWAAARAGLSPSAARWHAVRLVRAGYLRRSPAANLYPAGLVEEEDLPVFDALSPPETLRLYRAIVERGGSTQGELSAVLGLSPQATVPKLRALAGLDLVKAVADGRFRRYFATARLALRREATLARRRAFQDELLRRLRREGLRVEVVRRAHDFLFVHLVLGRRRDTLQVPSDPFATLLAD